MKKIFLLSVVVLSAIFWAHGQSDKRPSSGNDPEALLKLERKWAEATIHKDFEALEKIVADDYLIIDPAGKLSTKKEDLEQLKSDDLKFESMSLEQTRVRFYGSSAVVTGKSVVKGTYKGDEISGPYRFTDVFVRTGGEWKAVSSHVSEVHE